MMSDAQRPSTWKKYKEGMCEGCWAGCCTLPVEVSIADLIRLGLTDEEEASQGSKEIAKRLMKQKIIQSFRAKTGIFVLSQKSDDSCYYLGPDRRCTVYTKRPSVCRLFPKIGPRPGWCPVGPRKK